MSLAFALTAGVAALFWVLFLPVPLRWPLVLAERLLLPSDVTCRFSSADVHWLAGQEVFRIKFDALEFVAGKGVRFRADALEIEWEKSGLFRRRTLPTSISLRNPRLAWAGAAPAPAPERRPEETLSSALERVLALFDQFGLNDAARCELHVEGLVLETPVPGIPPSPGRMNLRAHALRQAEGLKVLTAASAESGWSVIAEGAIAARAAVCPMRLRGRLRAPLAWAEDETPASAALIAEAEYDRLTGKLAAGRFAIDGRKVSRALGLEVEPGKEASFEASGAFSGDLRSPAGWLLQLSPARVVVGQSHLTLRDLKVDATGASRLAWNLAAEVALDAGAIAALERRRALILPVAEADRRAIVDVVSQGEVRWKAGHNGGAEIEHAEGSTSIRVALGSRHFSGAVHLGLNAGTIAVEADLNPLDARGIVAALVSKAAAEAVPRVEVTGKLRYEARRGEAGRLRGWLQAAPFPTVPADPSVSEVWLRQARIEFSCDPQARRWSMDSLRIETSQGTLEGRAEATEDTAHRTIGVTGSVQGFVGDLPGLLRKESKTIAAAMARLDLGPMPVNLALDDFHWHAALRRTADRGWELTALRAQATLSAELAPERVRLSASGALAPDGRNVRLEARLAGLNLEGWTRWLPPDFPAMGLDQRWELKAGGLLDPVTFRFTDTWVSGHAGAGILRLKNGAALALRSSTFEMSCDPAQSTLRIPRARLELSAQVWAEIESAEIRWASDRRASGRLRWGAAEIDEFLVCWPENLAPKQRQTLKSVSQSGRLEAGTLDGAVDLRAGAVTKLEGELILRDLRLTVPSGQDAQIESVRIDVRHPAIGVAVKELVVADVRIPSFELRAVDVVHPPIAAELRTELVFPARAEEPRVRGEVDVELHGLGPGASPQATFAMRAMDGRGVKLRMEGAAAWTHGFSRFEEVTVRKLEYGASRLAGQWKQTASHAGQLSIEAEMLDLPDLIAGSRSILPHAGDGSHVRANATPPSLADFDAMIRVKKLGLGEDRWIDRLAIGLRMRNAEPDRMRIEGYEGGRYPLRMALDSKNGRQQGQFETENTASFLKACMPLLARMSGATLASEAQRIAALFDGGRLAITAEWDRSSVGRDATGTLRLEDATVVRAPALLRLLALKSGRRIAQTPLIRQLAIGRWAVSPDCIEIGGVAISGTGLIDQVRIDAARYEVRDGSVAASGKYFGVGFEIAGSRASPQVYLQENAFLRVLGQRNEFEFFGDDRRGSERK